MTSSVCMSLTQDLERGCWLEYLSPAGFSSLYASKVISLNFGLCEGKQKDHGR